VKLVLLKQVLIIRKYFSSSFLLGNSDVNFQVSTYMNTNCKCEYVEGFTQNSYGTKFQALAAMLRKISFFLEVTPFRLVHIYR